MATMAEPFVIPSSHLCLFLPVHSLPSSSPPSKVQEALSPRPVPHQQVSTGTARLWLLAALPPRPRVVNKVIQECFHFESCVPLPRMLAVHEHRRILEGEATCRARASCICWSRLATAQVKASMHTCVAEYGARLVLKLLHCAGCRGGRLSALHGFDLGMSRADRFCALSQTTLGLRQMFTCF